MNYNIYRQPQWPAGEESSNSDESLLHDSFSSMELSPQHKKHRSDDVEDCYLFSTTLSLNETDFDSAPATPQTKA